MQPAYNKQVIGNCLLTYEEHVRAYVLTICRLYIILYTGMMMFLSNCSDYHELEARFIQLESKYLVLLREYQEPHIGNDHIASFIEYTKVCSRSPCTRK